MSDLWTIALISAVIVFGHFLTLFGATIANDSRDRIIAGSRDGVPLSNQHRWLMLSNDWLPIKFSLAGYTALLSAVMIYIAGLTGSPDIKLLAYLTAGFFGFAFSAFLVLGISDFILCLRVMRETRRR
jgi:hypothetical protein